MQEVQAAGRALGVTVQLWEVRGANDFEWVFAALHQERPALKHFEGAFPRLPCACLAVEDNGCGIKSRHLASIFDPFFTTKQKGTGLGLAVVKQKLSEFGADINVSNVKPTGSRFTITFPVENQQAVR